MARLIIPQRLELFVVTTQSTISRECLCQCPVRKALQRRASRTAVIRHRQLSSTDFSDLGFSQFGVAFLNSTPDNLPSKPRPCRCVNAPVPVWGLSNRAYLPPPRLRRAVPVGFMKSSTTVSAFWPDAIQRASVTLPAGWASVGTKPLPTGSAARVITMGIWLVARFAARIAASPPATITSIGRSTSPCA